MGYEYDMKNLIAKLSGVWVESEKKEILKELQEVYRKAKTFDEVLELHSQHIDTSSIYGNDLLLSANRYEYYDDGLFAYEMYILIKNYMEDE